MSQETLAHNPFMMMIKPEVVLAAVERSEKLGRLNRRMCSPLDKVLPLVDAEGSDSDADGRAADAGLN